jgi:hypothetical protein
VAASLGGLQQEHAAKILSSESEESRPDHKRHDESPGGELQQPMHVAFASLPANSFLASYACFNELLWNFESSIFYNSLYA